MEPHEEGIDGLLRRSLSAPAPAMSPDFDERLMGELRRGSRSSSRYRWTLLAGYVLLSVATSAVVMRGQGLDWALIAGTIVAPLAFIEIAHTAWRKRYERAAFLSSEG